LDLSANALEQMLHSKGFSPENTCEVADTENKRETDKKIKASDNVFGDKIENLLFIFRVNEVLASLVCSFS
jgi:hypothetical protein